MDSGHNEKLNVAGYAFLGAVIIVIILILFY